MSNKTPKRLAQEELRRVEYSNINVWLIMKDNELAGKITAREARNDVLHVAFVLYERPLTNAPVYGYRRMTGAEYPKIGEAMADILKEQRGLLKPFNVIVGSDWNLLNTWQNVFEAGGFRILRAI